MVFGDDYLTWQYVDLGTDWSRDNSTGGVEFQGPFLQGDRKIYKASKFC